MIFLKGRPAVSLEVRDDYPLITFKRSVNYDSRPEPILHEELSVWLRENTPAVKITSDTRNDVLWLTFASEKDRIAFRLRWDGEAERMRDLMKWW